MEPTTLPLILASASPRRRALLRTIGLDPTVDPADIDESPCADASATSEVGRLAATKGARVRDRHQRPAVVLAADTAVVLEERMLGKPGDRAEARAMLGELSGRAHEVLTALWLGRVGLEQSSLQVVRTEVCFRTLSPAWIDGYLDIADWQDKAGSYGIQEHAALFIERFSGSWSNVVGLPLEAIAGGLEAIDLAPEALIGWLAPNR